MTFESPPPASSPSEVPALSLTDIRFRWRPRSEFELVVPAFTLGPRERVLLAGPSGSGKSTLLSLVSGVALPQAGRVEVSGTDLARLSGPARDQFRADHLGIIFQMFNLLPFLSALDNVLLPLSFSRKRRQRVAGPVEQEARRLLSRLGLPEQIVKRSAAELSVGEQQRIAAARALIGRPGIIIADEPTSSLDRDRQIDFIGLLREEVEAAGSALLLVSHDLSLAKELDRVVQLHELAKLPARRPAKAEVAA